jgi:hypothetical protein
MQEQKNYLLPQHKPDLKFSCEKREVVGSNEKIICLETNK